MHFHRLAFAFSVSAAAALAFSAPTLAASSRVVVSASASSGGTSSSSSVVTSNNVVKTTKVVGNSVSVTVKNGTPVVKQSQSCAPGISGFLYQSYKIIIGGQVIADSQTTVCP